jgi:L-ascorbate metabolism protein UlaG (beta-lactamase superfamily)
MGLVLTLGGKKIYHAGDTGLFLDMRLVAEMNGPLDVALLPIGDNFTMGVADAVKAAELIGARTTIPMHYDTFEVIRADPADFARQVTAAGGRGRVVPPGGTFAID